MFKIDLQGASGNNLHPRNRFTSRFRGFVVWLAQKQHHFSASPIPKPPAVRLTFRSTEKHHSYAVYKLTYRLGYSIIILIRVCLKSDRRKITDTKSCKRKDSYFYFPQTDFGEKCRQDIRYGRWMHYRRGKT